MDIEWKTLARDSKCKQNGEFVDKECNVTILPWIEKSFEATRRKTLDDPFETNLLTQKTIEFNSQL